MADRQPIQDVKFRNHIIPANTPLNIHIYGIQYSPKNWENPEKFFPERFENENQHDNYSFLSFGAGNRM